MCTLMTQNYETTLPLERNASRHSREKKEKVKENMTQLVDIFFFMTQMADDNFIVKHCSICIKGQRHLHCIVGKTMVSDLKTKPQATSYLGAN